jgi:endoglycosylceramidase
MPSPSSAVRTLVVATLTVLVFAAAADAAPKGPLSHEGRWITDKKGRVVILHGWNLVSKVGSYRPEDSGFSADDARFLHRHGFNTVRLGVIYKALEPEAPAAGGSPRYRNGYLRSLARTQRLLARHKITTLLDFHQDLYNEKFQGEGWPDWQVLDDVNGVTCPNELQQGFPNNYVVNAALNCAFDSFWANREVDGLGLQDRYAAAWEHVAQKFRGSPRLLGYNIINEPWPGTQFPTCISLTGCPLFDTQVLTQFSLKVIDAIREADSNSLVWYAPVVVFDFGADSSHGDTGDSRAGFAFNMYCLAGGFLPANPAGAATCSETYEITLDNAEKQSEETDDALLMTEWGATNDLAVVDEVVELADEHMMSWQHWHYCECDDPTTAGTGVQSVVIDPNEPPRGENVNRGKLKATSRPYPRAVAGTPLAYDFNPDTREFTMSYSVEGPDGQRLPRKVRTQVFIPPIHYRKGYNVTAEGARVKAKRRVVLLKRVRGATEVTVEVTPD